MMLQPSTASLMALLRKLGTLTIVSLLLVNLSVTQAAVTFSPHIGPPAWSPHGTMLVYHVRDTGVFTVTTDGEQQRIADAAFIDTYPIWTPDGEAIVSARDDNDRSILFRTPLDGGEALQLTDDDGWRPNITVPSGIFPAYSPDGQWIAFLSQRQGDEYLSLYIMTPDGENERRLTDMAMVDAFSWSPDSQTIAFTTVAPNFEGAEHLYTISPDGENLHDLVDLSDVDAVDEPAWSPDGEQMVFATVLYGDRNLEIMNSDGTNRRMLRERAYYPVYSPDGQQILFTTWEWRDGGLAELRVINADGTNERAITLDGGQAHYYNASWSPDGTQIAFVRFHMDEPATEDIVIANANGSDPRVLVSRAVE